MLASISYRYLKKKYGVISGSGAQAQNVCIYDTEIHKLMMIKKTEQIHVL
jgi:hypothetical protein